LPSDTGLTTVIKVFQSAEYPCSDWLNLCLTSVRQWCAAQGFEYQFLDDTLFERVPRPLRDKLQGRTPILADLARLTLLREHLAQEGGTAIWLDADTFVVDRRWTPDLEQEASFGEELWLEKSEGGGIRSFRQPHNAFMMFRADNPVLPFLHHVAHSMIARVDPAAIAPQMVGPKLLKALHNLASFHLQPEAGALSPGMAEELVAGGGPLSQRYSAAARAQTKMWNLCGSLAGQGRHRSNLQTLTRQPELFDLLAT